MKKWLPEIFPFFLLLLVCAGCELSASENKSDLYGVYFVSDAGQENGAVLAQEFHTLPDETSRLEGLLNLLFAGPERAELVSPFPHGTSLNNWKMEDQTACLDLSESYGGLSGVELSLADSCIVLTLCQLETVQAVYLTVEGEARPFRDRVLRVEDLLLENGVAGPFTQEVELWFRNGNGLGVESRTLELHAGDNLCIAALQALLQGPETAGLDPVCPEGTELLSLRHTPKQATVNLSARWLEGNQEETCLSCLYALVNTLDGLHPGIQVRFQVEGQALDQFGDLLLTEPLTRQTAPNFPP